jgi:eukaryotic-like serine/threonine-protein kinase
MSAEPVDHLASGTRPDSDDVPAAFAGYTIEGEIGRGGMGVVYKVFDPNLRRCVALKVLLNAEHASEEDVERFFREAESAASLQHPNIVPIHELNIHKGQHYYTMDYIEGEPLDLLLEDRQLSPRQAMEVALKVARALGYAHSKGVVHRDLKPGNIIVDAAGEPKVTDFGLAKMLGADRAPGGRSLTVSGAIMGTPSYMAPEQAAGRSKDVDRRTDVYAMGCMIYEMLAGEPPFSGSDAMDTLARHVQEMPTAPSRRGAKVASDAETICLKCLEKEPGRRYQSAVELAEDIRRFLDGEPISARRASFIYLMRRRIARNRVPVTVAGVAVLALAALGVWAHSRIRGEQQRLATVEQQRRDKADAACKLGLVAMYKGVFSDEQRDYQLNQAKAHFREALSLEPEHLEALKGICRASNRRWRMLEARRRKLPFDKRRDVQAQIFAELREGRRYAQLRAAARAKTKQ